MRKFKKKYLVDVIKSSGYRSVNAFLMEAKIPGPTFYYHVKADRAVNLRFIARIEALIGAIDLNQLFLVDDV